MSRPVLGCVMMLLWSVRVAQSVGFCPTTLPPSRVPATQSVSTHLGQQLLVWDCSPMGTPAVRWLLGPLVI
jgi:hypothetical protein